MMLKKLLSKFTPRNSFYNVNGTTVQLRETISNTILTVQNCTDLDLIDVSNSKLKSSTLKEVIAHESGHIITLESKALRFCSKAAANAQDVRYYLAGVCLNLSTGGLVGTDGHRLHYVKLWDVQDSYNERILPTFFIAKLLDIAKIYKLEALTLSFSKESVKFSINDITLTSDFIKYIFPNVPRVVPHKAPEVGQFAAFDAHALKMLKLVTKKVFPSIIFEAGAMSVKDAPQHNHFIANLTSCFPKSLKRYCYDIEYVTDFNRELDGGTVQEENGKLLIKKGEYSAVLMPVRL